MGWPFGLEDGPLARSVADRTLRAQRADPGVDDADVRRGDVLDRALAFEHESDVVEAEPELAQRAHQVEPGDGRGVVAAVVAARASVSGSTPSSDQNRIVRTGTPDRRASCPMVSRCGSAMGRSSTFQWVEAQGDYPGNARLAGVAATEVQQLAVTVWDTLAARPTVAFAAVLALFAVGATMVWRWSRTVVTIATRAGTRWSRCWSGAVSRHPAAPDTSGLTVSTGARRGPGLVLTFLGGYPAPSHDRDRRCRAGGRRPVPAHALDRRRRSRGDLGLGPQRVRRARRSSPPVCSSGRWRTGARPGCRTGSRRPSAGSSCSGPSRGAELPARTVAVPGDGEAPWRHLRRRHAGRPDPALERNVDRGLLVAVVSAAIVAAWILLT